MRLKIGQLARKTGLSVRALHHYDAIGLLSPPMRTSGGARLYGKEELVRLHRIEALKRLDYSLPDIRLALDSPDTALQDSLRMQIAALNAQALRAHRSSRHLQRLLDMISAGGEPAAAHGLDLLELMNMYQRHLSDAEMNTLLEPGDSAIQQTDASWIALIDEVRQAMQQAIPTDSPAAHALAWRWMRLVIRMTRNDAALANRLMGLQLSETRAQDIVGITPAVFAWIGEAFAHARCALFSKYMSPAQTEEVRRRQLAGKAHMDRWPALIAQLRALMQSGVDAQAEPAQRLVQQWQSLFRESYCGDDSALEARVREALMNEPDLNIGVGLDEAALDYLQRAHIVAHHMPRENAGPKPSALMVAMQRAAHQLLEQPLVLDDPMALKILGPSESKSLHAELDRYREPMAQGLRSFVVVRSRLADDEWAVAAARGVRQRVILGAGLDTSAYRDRPSAAPGREVIFEVDLPATQQWKRARLQESGIAVPGSLQFVPVDFESVSLAEGLARAGFDAREPAFFSWLGVTMYLDVAAVFETLRFIAGCAAGSAVLFDYVVPLAGLAPMMRMAMQQVTAQLAAAGEPWKSYFESAELDSRLAGLGFRPCRHWSPEELNRLYLSGRADGLHLGAGPSRLVLATV